VRLDMSEIIIPGKYKKRDILDKDCPDFCPYEDGTISKEKKYCALSIQCRQLGFKSDYITLVDPKTGKITSHDYLCTGQHPFFEERTDDEESS